MTRGPEAARGDAESAPTGAGATCGVRLEEVDFEGPLELLLHLIRKNEIDVYDIPVALVTEQFLAYLDRMTAEKLEAAGDFLLMAATLMRIKARMLLPSPAEADEDDLEDPRRELVARLLEYQQFKEIAAQLREHEAEALKSRVRGARLALDEAGDAIRPRELEVSLNDLLRAFAAALAARRVDPVHQVEPVRVTIEEKTRFVREILAARGGVRFGELFPPDAPRIELVVTFIALLEMVRSRELRLRQARPFDEIEVVPGRDDSITGEQGRGPGAAGIGDAVGTAHGAEP